jgi:hypothetical protein
MARLEKRQMIILGAMGIAVLYAAFDFLAPKKNASAPGAAQKTAELGTFVTDLTAGLGKDKMQNLNTLIFSRAEKEWTQDPFLDAKSYKAWSAAKAPVKKVGTEAGTGAVTKAGTGAAAGAAAGAGTAMPKSEFIYSGYLGTERKRMAIINGIEYAEGESLDVKGYVLKSVSPTGVVIENRGTGATVNVPLLE